MEKYNVLGSYPRSGKHTVRLVFQMEDFKGSIDRVLGGNCMGAAILSCEVSEVEDLGEDILEEAGGKIILKNAAGDEHIVDDPDDLASFLVAVEIIDYQRKSNG